MRVLVACEFSGVVRNWFIRYGHDAWSCDLLPCEADADDAHSLHFKVDVRAEAVAGQNWDLVVAFPPCTHLAVSGARWFKNKLKEQKEAVEFVRWLYEHFPTIAIENPIGVLSTKWRRPDQIIQPWMFGHGETKATCLWLKNLPLLRPTLIVPGREGRV